MTQQPINSEQLARAVVNQERWALARAITLVESRHPKHQAIATELVTGLMPKSGSALRIGITGVPGVGKSSFIDRFGSMLIGAGRRLAVLAVDPSSARTRGSILGDKTRMTALATDRNCFVRPSPTGGELGGVAAMTRETIIICEAAGFDTILVETVGVGQSENAVADMVDFFVVLMLPGAGDDLQGIKKGIVELADLLVINKADGTNIGMAEEAALQYRRALQIIEPKYSDWQTEVVLASAMTGTGLDGIWDIAERRWQVLQISGQLIELRQNQDLHWLKSDFERQLLRQLADDTAFQEFRANIVSQVKNRALPPSRAVTELIKRACSSFGKSE